ncbi:hypothetical protein RCL1_009077 [Eukaryota sp. TZLM3-RCL]
MASSEDFIDFFLELCFRFLDSENPLSLLYCPGEIAKNLKRDEITTLNSFIKRRHFAVHGVKLAGATYGKVEIVTKTLFSILEPLFTAESEELKRTTSKKACRHQRIDRKLLMVTTHLSLCPCVENIFY